MNEAPHSADLPACGQPTAPPSPPPPPPSPLPGVALWASLDSGGSSRTTELAINRPDGETARVDLTEAAR